MSGIHPPEKRCKSLCFMRWVSSHPATHLRRGAAPQCPPRGRQPMHWRSRCGCAPGACARQRGRGRRRSGAATAARARCPCQAGRPRRAGHAHGARCACRGLHASTHHRGVRVWSDGRWCKCLAPCCCCCCTSTMVCASAFALWHHLGCTLQHNLCMCRPAPTACTYAKLKNDSWHMSRPHASPHTPQCLNGLRPPPPPSPTSDGRVPLTLGLGLERALARGLPLPVPHKVRLRQARVAHVVPHVRQHVQHALAVVAARRLAKVAPLQLLGLQPAGPKQAGAGREDTKGWARSLPNIQASKQAVCNVPPCAAAVMRPAGGLQLRAAASPRSLPPRRPHL